MNADTFHITADDGLKLFVRRWTPEGELKAQLLLAHGMGEHSARYERLARAFTARGYAVIAPDHRGHGESIVAGQEAGSMGPDGFNRAVADLIKLGRQTKAEHPELPLVVGGHSMGSFLAQGLIIQDPALPAALLLSGTNGKPPPIATLGRLLIRLEIRRQGPEGRSALMRTMSFDDFNKKFKPNRTGFDWLSRDDAEVDKYVADPLCGFSCSNESWLHLLDALPRLTHAENLARYPKTLPVYLVSGEDDAVGLMGKGVRRLHQQLVEVGMSRVAIKVYPKGRHEIFNETNRDEVTAATLDWLDKALAAG